MPTSVACCSSFSRFSESMVASAWAQQRVELGME